MISKRQHDVGVKAFAGRAADAGLLEWLPLLDVEHDNVRAAFDWGIQTGASSECVRLMSALWQFWFVRGHLTEGRRRFEVALNAGVTEPRLRAMALIDVGQLMAYHGDFIGTLEFATEALKIAQAVADKRLEGRATGPLPLPSGETLSATGKRVSVRGADIVTLEGGAVATLHSYYDQVELMTQLGLMPEA